MFSYHNMEKISLFTIVTSKYQALFWSLSPSGVSYCVRDHAKPAPGRCRPVPLARRHLLLWRPRFTQPRGRHGAQGHAARGDRHAGGRHCRSCRQPLGWIFQGTVKILCWNLLNWLFVIRAGQEHENGKGRALPITQSDWQTGAGQLPHLQGVWQGSKWERHSPGAGGGLKYTLVLNQLYLVVIIFASYYESDWLIS